MIESADYPRVFEALPCLQKAGSDLRSAFFRQASLARIPAGRDLMAVGDRAEAIPLLISGQVRVYMLGESGREITLYRFNSGECCVLTADAIIGRRLFPANAQVEEESEMALAPAPAFEDWLGRYPVWRDFVFEAMSSRLASLMLTLDEVAFRRMDKRVAALLLGRESKTGQLSLTHQEIANELGSSREVISRVLEDFQARGLVQLARGTIIVTNRQRLKDSTEM